MNPENPLLLGFLLGTLKEQRELIPKSQWSVNDLNFIWTHIPHEPFNSDSSGIKAYELHRQLLKHPSLPSEIVQELFHLYEQQSINLKAEIYRHVNLPLEIYISLYDKALKEDNFLTLSWLLSNQHFNMSIMTKVLPEDEELMERWKFLWHLKNNSQEGSLIQQCLSKVVSVCDNKGFLNSFFYWLHKEKHLNGSWCHVFIKNPNTNSKILQTIISQYSNKLGEYQFVELLNHPASNVKILDNLLFFFKNQPTDSKIYNELLRLVRNNPNLTSEQLDIIFSMYNQHSELIELILQHPNFQPSLIWQGFLNEKLFETLPSNLQQLIKNHLKIN